MPTARLRNTRDQLAHALGMLELDDESTCSVTAWVVEKKNTQRIERKHLTLRTRIKRLTRKTICFSKSIRMRDIVIILFVNRYEFGVSV